MGAMKHHINKKESDKLFNSITSNGCREMNLERFHQALNEYIGKIKIRGKLKKKKCDYCDDSGAMPFSSTKKCPLCQ